MSNDLTRFTLKQTDFIVGMLQNAVEHPASRKSFIESAEVTLDFLNTKLAGDGVPEELKTLSAKLKLLLDGLSTRDPPASESKLREAVELVEAMRQSL